MRIILSRISGRYATSNSKLSYTISHHEMPQPPILPNFPSLPQSLADLDIASLPSNSLATFDSSSTIDCSLWNAAPA